MCNLQHTTFCEEKEQLSLEVVETRSIASVYIHVVKAVERVKSYRTIQGVIPISAHAQLEIEFGLFVAYLQIFFLH